MAISKKLVNYLENNKYRYSVIEHRTTYTAWDTAQTEKVKPGEVAKSLVLSVDNEWIIALVPADKNLDKKKLLAIFNKKRKRENKKSAKKVGFAPEVWMKKNIPGKVGATPPFREILKMEIYMDKLLGKNKKIYLGSGEYNFSLLINTSQYLKKEKPVLGALSVKRK